MSSGTSEAGPLSCAFWAIPFQIACSTGPAGLAAVVMRSIPLKRSGARRYISKATGPPIDMPPTIAFWIRSLSIKARASWA
jgi:hypothetical protein